MLPEITFAIQLRTYSGASKSSGTVNSPAHKPNGRSCLLMRCCFGNRPEKPALLATSATTASQFN
jgi:hypothetical protein